MVARRASSRLVYFPGDVERTMWQSGHTDLARLLQNSIRWVAGANAPVTIRGDGVIEAFAWETEAGFAVHVLNYTNPAMHRGWLRAFYPIGAQHVQLMLPANRRVTRVELLRAEADVPFQVAGGAVLFTIPSVADYEVAAFILSTESVVPAGAALESQPATREPPSARTGSPWLPTGPARPTATVSAGP